MENIYKSTEHVSANFYQKKLYIGSESGVQKRKPGIELMTLKQRFQQQMLLS